MISIIKKEFALPQTWTLLRLYCSII